ncbi:type II toxin-antitoxin system PemK/MazF family toxin [Demequina sediminicola]|uniref:type II toxin-antitoxin system PemK/MazF family toxin n=1 Tax=Demequina sediminicola TaxID=1095026 RepID=UPI000AE3A50F|nr:type II toxin-antitoxin system PemK/MazF family toxin [Demequina sediminicola]
METILAIVAIAAIVLLSLTGKPTRKHRGPRPTKYTQRTRGRTTTSTLTRPYPGDYKGHVTIHYEPHPDGRPDPGEIVWTWVPFEEDHTRGKDRPVLLIGYAGDWLLGVQLTSKNHDTDVAREARYGRHWLDIGTGTWDQKRRPSEIRLDRIVRVDPAAVRREGAILDKQRFDAVAHSLSDLHHW